LPSDIHIAYRSYYTHDTRMRAVKPWVKWVYTLISRGYYTLAYGYPSWRYPLLEPVIGSLVRLFPTRRTNLDFEVLYLPCVPAGKLLEVGCGSGHLLENVREVGWDVYGVEPDRDAIQTARSRNLEVFLGTLEAQAFQEGTFDVVVLSHVIEHVYDPLVLLTECRRVLRDGGVLRLFTPNAASLGHRFFRNAWRGLEPPRHLTIFTPIAIETLVQRAGFRDVKCFTTIRGATALFRASSDIQQGHASAGIERVWSAGVAASLKWIELLLNQRPRTLAEEITLLARK
jgi:2-polyprenyl-3-methyl-5-hydroxy-6-metoxy-1,4-benzoquinol methylase